MSKHDTVKTITENNILQKQNLNIFSRDKTKGVHKLKRGDGKKTPKQLTINKTCVCDPHSLNISFLSLGDEGKKGNYKVWTQ